MRSRRGFTLLEAAVVVAIVGIVAAIAVPQVSESFRRGRSRTAVRTLQEDLAKTRALATSSRSAAAQPTVRLRSAMLEFSGPTSYRVVGMDSADGTNPTLQETQKTVTFPEDLRLVSPTTFPVRVTFRSIGSLVPSSISQLRVKDTISGMETVLEISAMGTVRLQ